MAPNNNRRSNRSNRQPGHRTNNHNRTSRKQHPQPKRHFGCGICQADHRLTDCKKFTKMNLAQKYRTAVGLHYCVNCLARNHLIGGCTSKARCHKCGGKHHSILHGPERILKDLLKDRSTSTPSSSRTAAPIPAPRMSLITTSTTTLIPTTMTKTFVPTVVVEVVMEQGNQPARAILNPSLTKSRVAMSFVKDSWLNPFKIDDDVYVKVLIAPNLKSNLDMKCVCKS